VRSALNRARPYVMLARGAATRLLLPGIVTGGRMLCIGRNVGLVVYGELIVGHGVVLSDGCAIEVGPYGRLVLGDRTFVGRHSVIVAQERIEIGADVLIAEHCTIRDHNHQLDANERRDEIDAQAEGRHSRSGVEKAPVSIGASVWLGAGARVLKGSRIGDRTVVGANAVVRDELPPDVVAGGIPARVIRPVGDPT
jgi:carbonic anhydrase/acetyltransferase-like protein (isoleucine patch superfamily)